METLRDGSILSNKYLKFVDTALDASGKSSRTYENMLIAIHTKNITFHVVQKGETIDLAQGIDIQVLNPGNELSEDLN